MMGTIADKLQKLLGTKEAIRQAIIEKGQDVADSDTFASYPEKIAAIQTGMDTSDATATAADLLSGKTAYGPGGKITGTMPYETGIAAHDAALSVESYNSQSVLRMTGVSPDEACAIAAKGTVIVDTPLSNFGDAQAANVASGYYFTSSEGLKVRGAGTIAGTYNTVSVTITNEKSDTPVTVYYVNNHRQQTSTTIPSKGTSTLSVYSGGMILMKAVSGSARISTNTTTYSALTGIALIVTGGGSIALI